MVKFINILNIEFGDFQTTFAISGVYVKIFNGDWWTVWDDCIAFFSTFAEDNDVDMKPTDFELELHSEEESAGPSTRSESDTMLDIKPEPHIYSYPSLEQADDYLQSTGMFTTICYRSS